MYNDGFSRSDIADILHLGKTTISRYLKKATSINLCKYDPKLEMQKSAASNLKNVLMKIQCDQTVEVFDSLTRASEWCGVEISSISSFISYKYKNTGKRKLSAGKHPLTHEKLTWSLVEEV